MAITKKVKDQIIRAIFGNSTTPRGLFELSEYFRRNGPINFNFEKTPDGLVAVSTNFRQGSIVTSGKDAKELDKNIKDAILTSFSVPSSYAKEARVVSAKEKAQEYALA